MTHRWLIAPIVLRLATKTGSPSFLILVLHSSMGTSIGSRLVIKGDHHAEALVRPRAAG
jgi:hypothetical protein